MDEQTKLRGSGKVIELPSVYGTLPEFCPWCGIRIYRVFDELGDWMIYEKDACEPFKHHACESFNQWVEANKDILGFSSMYLGAARYRLWLAGKEIAQKWLKEEESDGSRKS